MSVRSYKLTWLLFLAIVALTFLTGNLTPIAGLVFGHILFGMIFMGMIAVLPASISHPAPAGPGIFTVIGRALRSLSGKLGESSHSWMSSNSVEVRHPKYH